MSRLKEANYDGEQEKEREITASNFKDLLIILVKEDRTREEVMMFGSLLAPMLTVMGEKRGQILKKVFDSVPHEGLEEGHPKGHHHGMVFTDGQRRIGKLATISMIEANSPPNPPKHQHPDNALELIIPCEGTLDVLTEGEPPKAVAALTPYQTHGQHTVRNPANTPAWYICLRFNLKSSGEVR